MPQFGKGPGVVHGTASSAHNHMQLAEALADAFTVYAPDRRGRGLSGPSPKDFSIQTEVDDLAAVLVETATHTVFGVSSGGIISLQAALTLTSIHKAAIYEPPLIVNGSVPTDILTRFDKEMAQGKVAAALITAMKGAQMGPPIFNAMPCWLTERLTTLMMKQEDMKGTGDYVPMRSLAPTMHYDFQLVVEMVGRLESFRAIQADVLSNRSGRAGMCSGTIGSHDRPRSTRPGILGPFVVSQSHQRHAAW